MRNSDEYNKDGKAIIGLSYIEKVALAAYLFDPSLKVDAYKVAKGITNTEKTDDELNSRANSWLTNKGCAAFIRMNKRIVQNARIADAVQNDPSLLLKPLDETKREMIVDLYRMKDNTTDNKEILDINKQLIDLQGLKVQQVEKQEKQNRYYLPERCEQCEMYQIALPLCKQINTTDSK